MNTIILPMAYRRYRHSVRRSSLAERTLPKMKDLEIPIKAETGELVTHRFPSVAMNINNNSYFSSLQQFVKSLCYHGLGTTPLLSLLHFSAGKVHALPAEKPERV